MNATEIIPRIWIGNITSAHDDTFLLDKRINVIFNCTKDLPFHQAVIRGVIKGYRVPIDDNLREEEIRNMSLWSFEIVYFLLKEYLDGNTILVHCAAGIQRSSSTVAMFLIALYKINPEKAIELIQSKRWITFRPGINFRNSIESFYNTFENKIRPSLMY